MAKRLHASNVSGNANSHWETQEAIDDEFASERAFIFESVAVGTSEGEIAGSRLSVFIRVEASRCLSNDRFAYRNEATLNRIIDDMCNLEQQIAEDPECLEARKEKHRKLVQGVEGYVGAVCVVASTQLQSKFQKEAGESKRIKLIKPEFLDDRVWKKAQTRLRSVLRKMGIQRDYVVGNKRPPSDKQFKGSGNPRGRPLKKSDWAAIKADRDRLIKGKTRSGRDFSVNRRDHKLDMLFRRALRGDANARRYLVELIVLLHRKRLLFEPLRPRRGRKVKVKFNDEEMELYKSALSKAYGWSTAFLRERYERTYGYIVDFEACVGLSDEDKALMTEIDKKTQTETGLSSAQDSAKMLHKIDDTPSTAKKAHPTLLRVRGRHQKSGVLAPEHVQQVAAEKGAKPDVSGRTTSSETPMPPYPARSRTRSTPLSGASPRRKACKV